MSNIAYYEKLIDKLQILSPTVFPRKPLPKIPLALGSVKAIQCLLNVPYVTADTVLKLWCQGRRYHTACIEGAPRYYINGTVHGKVTAKQAEYARSKLGGILCSSGSTPTVNA